MEIRTVRDGRTRQEKDIQLTKSTVEHVYIYLMYVFFLDFVVAFVLPTCNVSSVDCCAQCVVM